LSDWQQRAEMQSIRIGSYRFKLTIWEYSPNEFTSWILRVDDENDLSRGDPMELHPDKLSAPTLDQAKREAELKLKEFARRRLQFDEAELVVKWR
jgi:hypothetical protein